ncbi:hypothetical protein CCACVL1_15535 [Corchorus capsularis]|uniref:Uncharacterized protein n=1 Tax=Corchorus capsularis TaxID=210143 RepID=A0A1R3I209_COCAP|nr:hypothetical protein CCACVL1_15535 [Corchorus capsularis]
MPPTELCQISNVKTEHKSSSETDPKASNLESRGAIIHVSTDSTLPSSSSSYKNQADMGSSETIGELQSIMEQQPILFSEEGSDIAENCGVSGSGSGSGSGSDIASSHQLVWFQEHMFHGNSCNNDVWLSSLMKANIYGA